MFLQTKLSSPVMKYFGNMGTELLRDNSYDEQQIEGGLQLDD